MSRDINKENSIFWNEICGTALAKHLGIKDNSLESLEQFDKAYFDHIPYLLKCVNIGEMKGKKVLEIGLGYGTLGQRIAEVGADYTGLDLATNPVQLMNYRLRIKSLSGRAIQGNILESPFNSEVFDYVVAIGCFHHTGNVQQCIDETYRILKPGGQAFIMIYNQYSYYQWCKWPLRTFYIFLSEHGFYNGQIDISYSQRLAYDRNSFGEAAPETVFLSIRLLRYMFKDFYRVRFMKQDFGDIRLFGITLLSRKYMLSSFAKIFGLDIYIQAQK